MRSVIAAATAAFLLLGFAAHSTERVPARQTIACIVGGSGLESALAPRASTCCDVNHKCSQYLSTQILIRGPSKGRT